ncbi:hypothetical protein [Aromatoleum diolicum]|uniref:hypothetical protein n=1 Tax=Aromatoleum diolicum TaxID=75796 RepID=UPI001B7CF320|nr:hypothetical protein [Aromatoleum diolicum]
MMELLGASAAVIALLFIAYFVGSKKKREGLAWLEARPGDVSRLYLRAAPEIDAYWLHAEMKNGKKRVIAAPWEVEETLRRLASSGLRLSAEDQATLDATLARESVTQGDSRQHAHGTVLRRRAQA